MKKSNFYVDSDFYAQQAELGRDVSEVEGEALARFKVKDQQIDGLILGIIDKLDMVEQGLVETSDVILKFSKMLNSW
jgi:hypothetical protein